MDKVIVESPYAGEVVRNTIYARRCMRDCINRGEAPIAFHLLYTQVLDDTKKEERNTGLYSSFRWHEDADFLMVYEDYGISPGMQTAIKFWKTLGFKDKIIKRRIGKNEHTNSISNSDR